MTLYKVYTIEKGIVETDLYANITRLTFHREDGPALIEYDNDGNLLCEEYMFNGKYHRLNGPAYIEYIEDGSIYHESYHIYGTKYTKEQYEKELLKLKVQSL